MNVTLERPPRYTTMRNVRSALALLGISLWNVALAGGLGPGSDGTATLCATGASVQLVSYLGGSPDAGGTWDGPAAHPGTFDPVTDVAGVFTYTVAGPPVESASVTVTVVAPANAGSDGTYSTCSNGAAVDLFTQLAGTPGVGGAWTFAGLPVSNTYSPGNSAPGVYTYTVAGTSPCPDASASVTVSQTTAPDAGVPASITICSNAAAFSLRSQLTGTPEAGGVWSPGGSDTFAPGTSLPGIYTYTVTGTAPCADATSTLTVAVNAAPLAGTGGPLEVCSNGPIVDLFLQLTGADPGGTWAGPLGPHSGQFQPGTEPGGAYVYTVPGLAPCTDATATIMITVNPAPVAGTSASVAKCSSEPAFSLISQLGGSPATGGTWLDPNSVAYPSGIFTPGTSLPGLYTYTVAGAAPCASATATVNVSVAPGTSAGSSSTISVCSSGGTFQLFDQLGGSPVAGGAWSGPSAVPGGSFTPGVNGSGVYTYTVPGIAPCSDATATVTVTVVAAANAGGNGSVTLCSNSAVDNLFTHLGGSPSSGGSWEKPAPGGVLTSGLYDPANPAHPTGTYTYTVLGTAPCPNVSATVQVVENQAPNAGTNGSTTVCSTGAAFDLGTVLGGSADAGGVWLNGADAPMPPTFTPGTTLAGVYRYVVAGTAPCTNDTGFATVNVVTAPVAGLNGSTTVCSDAAAFPLLSLLGGTPGTGTWTDPDNHAFSGTYVPGTSALPGAYTYTVAGISPCASASAVVTITQNRRPVAGTNGTLSLCSTAGATNLFPSLAGTPDAGGTWTAPGGVASSGVFTPVAAGTFVYKYKVTGTAPCAPDSATVTVTVAQAPNAGISGTITICTGQVSVDLFNGLGGTPDINGTWQELSTTGRLSTHFFNPSTPTQLPPGNYQFTYTVPAVGLCAAATANVQVTIVPVLDAGSNGVLSVCSSNTAVDLFSGLAGSPQTGGNWTDLDATGLLTGQYFNANGAAGTGPYHFRYKLTGALGCSSDSAVVTVNITLAPNAGISGMATFCSDGPPASLFPYLGNTAQNGGTWRKPPPGNEIFSGIYEPINFTPGAYTYTVGGTPPCASSVATLQITETPSPNAGTPAVYTVCSNTLPFDMLGQLGGTPAPNGTWTAPGNTAHNSTFNPQLDVPGVYIYRVAGVFPCADKTTTLTVNVNTAPYAGADATTTVCVNASGFPLFSLLSASGAQAGGSWFDPVNAPFPTGFYQPGTSAPGVYKYRVNGVAPCTLDEATVTVFQTTNANAGASGTAALCANGPAASLVNYLGGTPDLTGTWTGPAPGTAYFSGTFVPGTSVTGVYTYLVNGVPPCANASSTVTVTIIAPPNAGTGRNFSVCQSVFPIVLLDSLVGTPATNGTWTLQPGNTPSNGIFTPNTPGTYSYRYTVPGTGPCGSAQSTLNITVNPSSNAGTNGTLALCSTSGSTALFPSLGGSPQSGGTWTYNGVAHASSFNPLVDLGGNYVYTVNGLAPCANVSATVSVTLNTAPNAGSNGVLTICDSDPTPIVLRNVLNGTPGLGGSWTLNGSAVSDIYVPGNYTAGSRTFTYTVPGQAPCAAATAQATIIQYAHPVAGSDGSLSLCTNGAPVSLLASLGGNPNGTGSWINAANNFVPVTFNPAANAAGTYVFRYIVTGTSPCVNDTSRVTVTLNKKPEAGISTAPVICSDATSTSLLVLLGGTPDNNGSWTFQPTLGPPVAHGPVFNPAIDGAGAYIYTVAGTAPCTNASATVQVTLSPAPNAGLYNVGSACATETSVVLFGLLNGTPQTGGAWTAINSTGHLTNGVFNPTGLVAGNYRFLYTVTGSAACGNDTATVQITVVPALNAGNDASVTLCASQVVFLTPLLGGSPQPGGVWSGVESPTGLVNGVLNAGAAGVGTHHYRYVLATGSANCAPDTAILTVLVLAGPQAGADGGTSVCSNGTTINLNALIGGPHDLTGTWYLPAPGGVLGGSTVDPSTGVAGIYRYIVPAIGTCPADTAFVSVAITTAPNAGTDGTLAFCSNGAPQNMGLALGGTPNAGGSWTLGNGGPSHPPVYDPAVDVPGNYVYTVAGQSPCTNAIATVVVTETPQPFAGTDNGYTICSTQASFSMLQQLAGGPQSGGTWQRVGTPNTPHGQAYNPAVDSSGTFLYIVGGNGPCVSDSALLVVNEVRAPRAGTPATLAACPSDTLLDLFAALGSNADSTGSWTGAGGLPASSIFNPSTAPLGTYAFTYTVAGGGPCTAASSVVTVVVGASLNVGISGADTICGGQQAYDLFGSLGGTPDDGGTWSLVFGGDAITGHFLNAGLLPPGSAYPLVYTLEDPGCGTLQSTVDLYLSPYPDPGGDSTLALCYNEAIFPLLTGLSGTPDTGGTWNGPDGPVLNGLFNPATGTSGAYIYLLAGNGVCSDTTATVTITVSQPANTGQDGSVQVCNIEPLPLFLYLGGTPQPGGVWNDLSGTGALVGDTVYTAQLIAGTYLFQYAISVPGCTQDSTILTVTIVDGVQVGEVQRICNEATRTYTVSFPITGGVPSAYSVMGGAGSISAQAPFVFTSAPINANQPFSFTIDDVNHCSPQQVSGTSPCTFDEAVLIPESFTPNGDGINDVLEIPGIQGYPANSISIFNRWGAEVYSATGYDNKGTVWNGSSPKALIPGDAPSGTYYYVLELGNGSEAYKGFIYLNR